MRRTAFKVALTSGAKHAKINTKATATERKERKQRIIIISNN
jgi:hypothetical protein